MEVARVFFFFWPIKKQRKVKPWLMKTAQVHYEEKMVLCLLTTKFNFSIDPLNVLFCFILSFRKLTYQTLLPTIATSFASWVNLTYAAYCLHISKKRITKPNWTRFESTVSCNRVLMAGNYYIVIGSASSTLWRDLSFF